MQTLEHVRFPEEAGLSSRSILNYIAAREKTAGTEHHAVWVLRHGKVAAKLNWAPYDDRTPHMLFSLSKAFCSTAAGFAVAEGLLHWDTKLIDVLPEKFPENPSGQLKSITLHHLLTMGSGLKPESDEVEGEDWASAVLACGCDHEPGTHFHYNSHGTYLVSCMVQKVTGQTCRDYLVPRLFEPLGMMNEDGSAPAWDCCPAGVNVGGWGLWLSCAQIAPFGQCLLQKGVWDGRQVLPREWLDRATVSQIDNGNGEHEHDHDWNQGYGYQFWMCKGGRYRGDGAFGQYCIVDEKRDMVICAVSGVQDMGKSLDLFYEHLFGAADPEPGWQESPSCKADQAALQEALTALAYPWPAHDGSPLPTGIYEADGTVMDVQADQVLLTLPQGEKFLFYVGRAEEGGGVVTCCGMSEGRLQLFARVLRGPFTLSFDCRFTNDEVRVTVGGVSWQDNANKSDNTFTLRRR